MALQYFLAGFKLIAAPGIRIWVIIPLLITLVLFVMLTLFALEEFKTLMAWLINFLPDWLSFITWLARIVFTALLAVCYVFTFTLVGHIVASPFYGLLSNAVYEKLCSKANEPPLSFRSAGTIALQSFKRELQKLVYFIPRIIGVLLLCVILSFIPVVNLLAPALAFLWGAWSLALQNLDYPADINTVDFANVRKRCAEKKGLSLSFGALVLLGSSVPLLNLLVMPAAVAGATSLWIARFREDDI